MNRFSKLTFFEVLIILVLVTSTAITGCSSSSDEACESDSRELDVAASAGLSDAFAEIGTAFDQQYGSTTSFNLANATVLKEQIAAGAGVDVFASADPKRMKELVQAGLVDQASVHAFAGNELVVIVSLSSDLDIGSVEGLAHSDIRRIATGEPRATPVGRAALEVLDALGIAAAVEPKLIYTQIVNQAVEYAARGDVDAALVWSSEAQIQSDRVRVVATASQSLYEQPAFVIGIVGSSKDKEIGQDFIDYILGPDGRSTLRKYGFLDPPSE